MPLECFIVVSRLLISEQNNQYFYFLSMSEYTRGDIASPSVGMLEQNLSQRIKVLYLTQLGHEPDKVECRLINQTLTIIVENPVTQPERVLLKSGKQEFAEQVRSKIHKAFQPQLKALIEEVVGTRVLDLLGDSKIQTGRTSILAILAT